MILNIEIPDSDENFSSAWEPGFEISTQIYMSEREGNTIIIHSNSAGLISLARYLLLLAQPSLSKGKHYHFDDQNSLEAGSVELIIHKTD
jgi:hypothetical protein